MPNSVQIIGLQELGDSVEQFTQKVQRQMIRKATNAGAEVFRREIRAKAPVRDDQYLKGNKKRAPGYLKKHIGRTNKALPNEGFQASVGPTKSAFYGRFLELGTSHQPATPFMRPAFDSKTGEAETAFANTLKQQIAEALK